MRGLALNLKTVSDGDGLFVLGGHVEFGATCSGPSRLEIDSLTVGGFHVTSSPPCWGTKTKDLSLASFVRPPEVIHFFIVIGVARSWLKTSYTFPIENVARFGLTWFPECVRNIFFMVFASHVQQKADESQEFLIKLYFCVECRKLRLSKTVMFECTKLLETHTCGWIETRKKFKNYYVFVW